MKQFILNLLKAHKDKIYHFFCSYTAMLTAMDKSMEAENE